MAQERFHINELNGLALKDYRNIPAIAEILCKQFGMTDLWWFILGQVNHESLVFDDSKRDYKASAPFFNIMGMRPAKVRNTYQMEGSINGKGQYGQYVNYADALADLMYWLKINKILEGFQIQKVSGNVNYAALLKAKKYMTGNETSYNNGIMRAQEKYGAQWLKWSEKPFFDESVVTTTNAGGTTEETTFQGVGGLTNLSTRNPMIWLLVLGFVWWLWKSRKPKARSFNSKYRRR